MIDKVLEGLCVVLGTIALVRVSLGIVGNLASALLSPIEHQDAKIAQAHRARASVELRTEASPSACWFAHVLFHLGAVAVYAWIAILVVREIRR